MGTFHIKVLPQSRVKMVRAKHWAMRYKSSMGESQALSAFPLFSAIISLLLPFLSSPHLVDFDSILGNLMCY